MDILLMDIGDYSIRGYWWLLIGIILVAILLMTNGGYFISGYWWLLYVILQLLMIIAF